MLTLFEEYGVMAQPMKTRMIQFLIISQIPLRAWTIDNSVYCFSLRLIFSGRYCE